MRHYPRHIGDFVSATVGLSLAERGAYTALLDRYYADEKPLDPDKTECYRAAGAITASDRKAVDYVLSRYFTLAEDGYHNKRADQEIAGYQNRAEQARENGKHGGRPSNQKITQPVPVRLANETEEKANQEPVTSNQRSSTPYAASDKKPRSPPSAVTPTPTGWEGIADETRTLWLSAYPAVDLEAELAAALVWVHANPANKKSNWQRFLSAWLKRAQDHAPVRQTMNGHSKQAADWWSSEDATMRKASELGLSSRAGESWNDLRGRIRKAIDARH